jgi:hypothetical protein
MTRAFPIFSFLLFLTACAAPDAHIPDFARVPYETMTRETVVAVALREWRLFGSLSGDDEAAETNSVKWEREPGLWQRVGEYWWLGLDARWPERRWTGKHDAQGRVFAPERDGTYAWSAAFISYVMRISGAGRGFPYSPRHSDYINAARRASLAGDRSALLWAEPPDRYSPKLGDLICFGRAAASDLRFEDLPAPAFPGHCEIVVAIEPGRLAVIGGNADDAVEMKHVPIATDGRLAASNYLTVIEVRYDR